MDAKDPLPPGPYLLALKYLFHPLATKPKGRWIAQRLFGREARSLGAAPQPTELWETKSQGEVTGNKTGTATSDREKNAMGCA